MIVLLPTLFFCPAFAHFPYPLFPSLPCSLGSTSVQGNQGYGPYGNKRYSSGSMGTNKGFTGQYEDATGLDYYNARYYDPVVGRLLSADTVQGNMQGMDPYAYVGGNPETATDPTGHRFDFGDGSTAVINQVTHTTTLVEYDGESGPKVTRWDQNWNWIPSWSYRTYTPSHWLEPVKQVVNAATGIVDMSHDVHKLADPKADGWTKTLAGADLAFNIGMDALLFTGVGEEARLVEFGTKESVSLAEKESATLAEDALKACELSFSSTTQVATAQGHQDIGSLKVGQKVWAYNPKTQKMELEPIQHVWINNDNDLVDLVITSTHPAKKGQPAQQSDELIHTTQKHPFLTEERGFVPVAELHVGMHVRKADGSYGEITGWYVVPGTSVMYNLTVTQDHTYTVGDEHWVVHNADGCTSQVQSWIKRSVYQEAKDKIGKDGVRRFTNAMKNGIVGPQGQQGIKRLTGSVAGYELKVLAKQYANWRFYGNFDEETGHIIFDEFGQALH